MSQQTYVLMAKMLQQLELTVGSLGEDWSTERLHDLLDCNGLSGELVLCGAEQRSASVADETIGEIGWHTRRDRKHPFLQAAGPCI